MYTGQIVFSQLMDFLPRYEFNQCVSRYQGNYRLRKFSCLDQFLCMAFAQLTYRESLRDIQTCLRALQPKLYHAGIRGKVSRSTLADANESRDWRIYADFAQVLIRIARTLYAEEDFGLQLQQTVCLRLQHDRSLSFALPLGSVSQTQGRDQTPHFDGLTRQHSLFYPDAQVALPRAKHTTSTSSTN